MSNETYVSDYQTENAEAAAARDAGAGDISLLELLIVLAKQKRIVLGVPIIGMLLGLIYSFTQPDIYTATTRIMPPAGQSSSANMLAQISGLAGLVPGATIKTPNDVYVAMLRSRTVADNLIERFDLMKHFDVEYRSLARRFLEQVSTISLGKDGVITIEVDDQNAKMAAALANAYVDELYKLTNVLAVTEASQRRLFFERQFAGAKENLAKAEAAARQALQKGGIVQVEGQSRAMMETTARLRGHITAKEVQISAMRTFATAQNPELLASQRELEAMRQELAKLEGEGRGARDDALGDMRGMDSLRMLRNVKYHETIYELLAKQYELAKLDESKDSGLVQVLDAAIEPDRRSKPKRRQIVLIWTVIALFAGILLAFLWEALSRARRDPAKAEQLSAFRHYLTSR